MSRIHVLHENAAWVVPLAAALDQRHLPWAEWFLHTGTFDLSAPPPEGVFYNRMSASSHTRDHRYAAELTAGVLAWLSRWGRRVINGPAALDLEISKVRQYAALESAGIRTPRTVLVAGRDEIVAAARAHFAGGPVILKPNRGGKGLGVQLFHTLEGLEAHVQGAGYVEPVDGLQLLQEYVHAPRPVITRAEFVGSRFVYAVEVDTSEGFELCPADVCAIGDAVCPVGDRPAHKFTVTDGIAPAFRARLERFLSGVGIDVAGIEFIVDETGRVLVYDVNTNTNYNAEAEARAGVAGTGRSGMGALAEYLGAELARTHTAAA
ncbi:ATP-grasp domain-containing protein [Limobrevibacterium gyesilva]|uniref:Alpha-L-glutamate ligase n=1 Tax=Limobrevibacterium gyesilva TaxID=2991712 RepID=A0AA41YJR0_9PROT|nr:alpha-L-glutamate ligase [Limobrevibacterium gyesilva]MCW3474981.1 alpha-L-glutamate ligase [Limobrevibacterium gyesilva]